MRHELPALFRRRLVPLLVEQDLGKPDDGVERRVQVMALVIDDAELGFEVTFGLHEAGPNVLVLADGRQLGSHPIQLGLHGTLFRLVPSHDLARGRATPSRLSGFFQLALQ